MNTDRILISNWRQYVELVQQTIGSENTLCIPSYLSISNHYLSVDIIQESLKSAKYLSIDNFIADVKRYLLYLQLTLLEQDVFSSTLESLVPLIPQYYVFDGTETGILTLNEIKRMITNQIQLRICQQTRQHCANTEIHRELDLLQNLILKEHNLAMEDFIGRLSTILTRADDVNFTTKINQLTVVELGMHLHNNDSIMPDHESAGLCHKVGFTLQELRKVDIFQFISPTIIIEALNQYTITTIDQIDMKITQTLVKISEVHEAGSLAACIANIIHKTYHQIIIPTRDHHIFEPLCHPPPQHPVVNNIAKIKLLPFLCDVEECDVLSLMNHVPHFESPSPELITIDKLKSMLDFKQPDQTHSLYELIVRWYTAHAIHYEPEAEVSRYLHSVLTCIGKKYPKLQEALTIGGKQVQKFKLEQRMKQLLLQQQQQQPKRQPQQEQKTPSQVPQPVFPLIKQKLAATSNGASQSRALSAAVTAPTVHWSKVTMTATMTATMTQPIDGNNHPVSARRNSLGNVINNIMQDHYMSRYNHAMENGNGFTPSNGHSFNQALFTTPQPPPQEEVQTAPTNPEKQGRKPGSQTARFAHKELTNLYSDYARRFSPTAHTTSYEAAQSLLLLANSNDNNATRRSKRSNKVQKNMTELDDKHIEQLSYQEEISISFNSPTTPIHKEIETQESLGEDDEEDDEDYEAKYNNHHILDRRDTRSSSKANTKKRGHKRKRRASDSDYDEDDHDDSGTVFQDTSSSDDEDDYIDSDAIDGNNTSSGWQRSRLRKTEPVVYRKQRTYYKSSTTEKQATASVKAKPGRKKPVQQVYATPPTATSTARRSGRPPKIIKSKPSASHRMTKRSILPVPDTPNGEGEERPHTADSSHTQTSVTMTSQERAERHKQWLLTIHDEIDVAMSAAAVGDYIDSDQQFYLLPVDALPDINTLYQELLRSIEERYERRVSRCSKALTAELCRLAIPLLIKHDTESIFSRPMIPPLPYITNPIDLWTMEIKIDRMEYVTLQDFKTDLDLLVRNRLFFNRRKKRSKSFRGWMSEFALGYHAMVMQLMGMLEVLVKDGKRFPLSHEKSSSC